MTDLGGNTDLVRAAAPPLPGGRGRRHRDDPRLRPGPRHGHEPHASTRCRSSTRPTRSRSGTAATRCTRSRPSTTSSPSTSPGSRTSTTASPTSSATGSGSRCPRSARRTTRSSTSRRRSGGWRRSSPAAAPRRCRGRSRGSSRTLWNKTLRWPGHFAAWKAYMDAGLLETEPIDVGGVRVVPRDVLHAVLDPKLRAKPGEPDLVIVRVLARGRKDGRRGRGRRRADRPLRRGDRLHGDGADDRLGRLDQGDPERARRDAARRPPGGDRGPGPRYAEELRRRGFSLTETWSERGAG